MSSSGRSSLNKLLDFARSQSHGRTGDGLSPGSTRELVESVEAALREADEERAAIVAWLRNEAHHREGRADLASVKQRLRMSNYHAALASVIRDLVDAIEKGEHHAE